MNKYLVHSKKTEHGHQISILITLQQESLETTTEEEVATDNEPPVEPTLEISFANDEAVVSESQSVLDVRFVAPIIASHATNIMSLNSLICLFPQCITTGYLHRKLYCLNIEQRIHFKIYVLVFRCLPYT